MGHRDDKRERVTSFCRRIGEGVRLMSVEVVFEQTQVSVRQVLQTLVPIVHAKARPVKGLAANRAAVVTIASQH